MNPDHLTGVKFSLQIVPSRILPRKSDFEIVPEGWNRPTNRPRDWFWLPKSATIQVPNRRCSLARNVVRGILIWNRPRIVPQSSQAVPEFLTTDSEPEWPGRIPVAGRMDFVNRETCEPREKLIW